MPKDAFVIPTERENIAIPNYQMQAIEPLHTIRESYRISLFGSENTEVVEREGEVLAVDMTVKRCAELDYFSNQDVMTQYGTRDWVSIICRIPDFHGGTPDPDQTLAAAAGGVSPTSTFKEITRMRSCIGKFYAPMDDLRAKGIMNIEPGDRVIVEFQDKTKFENGIIKEVYAKKNLSTYAPAGGGAGGAFAPGAGGLPFPSGGPANLDNPSLSQEFWTLVAVCYPEGAGDHQSMADVAQSIYNRYYLGNSAGGYPKNLAKITSTGAYEATYKTGQGPVWQRITDKTSAATAIMTLGGYTVESAMRALDRSVSALRDPAARASALQHVGMRPDFLAGQPSQPVSGLHQTERQPYPKHNNFHVRRDNTIKSAIISGGQILPGAPVPAHIRPFIESDALPSTDALNPPPAGGTTPPAGGGIRTPFGTP